MSTLPFLATDEWSPLRLSPLPPSLLQKSQDRLATWMKHLLTTRRFRLHRFLQQATASHRLREVLRLASRQPVCYFSGTIGTANQSLLQGVFIQVEDNQWTRSRAYVYQSVYGVLARVCMVLGDLQRFAEEWQKKDSATEWEDRGKELNGGVEFVQTFIGLSL
jgi:hypothetical protein